MQAKINRLTFVIAILLGGLIYLSLAGCEATPPDDSREAQAKRGKVHFLEHCADCHGEDGSGLKIDSLNIQPADLTRITAKTKDKRFPLLRVARQIDGRQMSKAHGTRQMPVWGEVFSVNDHMSEDEIKGKLGEIIAYVMSIQD